TVAVGDFNDDGKLDLATLNWGYSGLVSVILGNGNGTFQPALFSGNSPNGVPPDYLAVGDFNGDGKLDLATARFGTVSVLLGNGDGTFQPAQNTALNFSVTSLAVGDFNADGKLDLVATSNLFVIDGYDPYYGSPYGHSEGKVNVLLG